MSSRTTTTIIISAAAVTGILLWMMQKPKKREEKKTNTINIISACSRTDYVIGHKGRLPWSIKTDWEYFLEQTKNGILIMGRTSYEEFQSYASSEYDVIVLSRNPNSLKFTNAPYATATSLQEAITMASDKNKTIWICGGEAIYKEALPIADYLYLTIIDATFEGDTYFPSNYKTFFPTEVSKKSTTCSSYNLDFLILGKEK